MAEAHRIAQDSSSLRAAQAVADRLMENIERVVLGKHEEIALVLAALASGGHVLLEDVPGTAKTILARSIAQTIADTSFARIQCTPDLQPTDVTGLAIYNQKTREFEFRAGPIFANIVLVDEINRAMPRTQSALLEAMAERQVTVDGVTRPLPSPFLVIATENPIEQEGTFPLPEAQLDRFALRSALGYPSETEEVEIVVAQRHGHPIADLQPHVDADDVDMLTAAVEDVYVDELILRWIVDLVRGDARGRGRGERRVGPRQPHARADGARVGADARPRPRRPRRRRRAVPAGARPQAAPHAVLHRRDACARPRRGAASGSRSAASRSRRRPRRTGTSRPPVSRGDQGKADVSAGAAPAARRPSLRRPPEPAPRPRQRRDRDAAVRDRRPVSTIDWFASARLSAATGRDEFIVRDHAADEAPRVVLVCDRRPAMGIYESPLPWLSKPAVVAEATAALVASAVAARADVASLDYGDGLDEPYWLPPGRRDVPWLAQERQATAPFQAPDDNVERALEFLGRLHSDLPTGKLRVRAVRLPRAAAARRRGSTRRRAAGTWFRS